MEESIFNKYKIIKTIDSDFSTSVYVVEEIGTGKNYALRKLLTNTSSPLYQTAIKEFREISKQSQKIDKKSSSPTIVDFFVEDGNSYFLLTYTDEASLKTIISYPSLGKILNNRYVVVRGIATGGFGVVYLIRDLSLPGKYWALKEMHEEEGIPEVIEKSFRVEADMLSSLEHPSIPRIADFFVDTGKLYFVMDYVNGETLKKILSNLKKGEYFPEDDVIKWAISICDVLHYLHNRPTPIVFRDLKPDNIMITLEGELKLIDFGIARVFQGPKSETTKYALLTEGYAPQEQWIGKAEPRSDVYSLGATLYHLLSGVHPKQVAPEFPPIEKFNPSVSPALSKLVSKTLEPKLADRYQTVDDMKSDLLKLITGKKREESARYHISRANKFEAEGDYFSGNFEYMKALEYDENNYEILTGVARCCEKLGFYDRALLHYEKILKLDVTRQMKDTIVKKADELRKKLTSGPGVKIQEKDFRKSSLPDDKSLASKRKETIESQKITPRKKGSLWPKILIGLSLAGLPLLIIVLLVVVIGGLWITNPDMISYFFYSTPTETPVPTAAPTAVSDTPEKWYKRGVTFYGEKRYEEAINCFDKALELDPNYGDAWKNKGMVLYDQKKYEDAIQAYDKYLDISPEDAVAWNEKGNALYAEERYDEALECYKRALKYDSTSAIYWCNKGLALDGMKKYDEAVQAYDKSVEIDPEYGEGWNYKGNALFIQSKNKEALECYEQAIKCNPETGVYWNNKGLALYNLGRNQEAVTAFDKSINFGYEDWTLWNDRGNSLYSLAKYQGALDSYEHAIKLKPDDAVIWTNKGLALAGLRKYRDAIECYDKALKIDPSSTTASQYKKEASGKL